MNETKRSEDCPTAWFVMLEHAKETGDVRRAMLACRELERLGIVVTYLPKKKGGRA